MVISKENAAHYTWGQQCDGWHLVRSDNLSVIHERMPPNTSEVCHYHSRSRQFFFVLSGTATLDVNGEPQTLTAGQGYEVDPGVLHQMKNLSSADVEFIVISQPPGQGDRVPC